jgi:glycosyltransferase involved in cell wall biosynthesis
MVGFVGRLDRNKRVEDFITAASLVLRHLSDARFVVAGGGVDAAYAEDCRDLAARLDLGEQLTFAGPIPDAQPVLRAVDVLVLPSVLEGHPLVLLEAMALGKPVVATDIPGCREVIRDGVEGLLVPPRNPEAIAAAVIGLLGSPGERARLGAAAHARVREEFSEERMLSRLLPLVTGA